MFILLLKGKYIFQCSRKVRNFLQEEKKKEYKYTNIVMLNYMVLNRRCKAIQKKKS